MSSDEIAIICYLKKKRRYEPVTSESQMPASSSQKYLEHIFDFGFIYGNMLKLNVN